MNILNHQHNRSLDDRKYEKMEVASSLHRVISYWTVRDKFKDVNPALKAIGVEKIEILDNGLLFFGNIKPMTKKETSEDVNNRTTKDPPGIDTKDNYRRTTKEYEYTFDRVSRY